MCASLDLKNLRDLHSYAWRYAVGAATAGGCWSDLQYAVESGFDSFWDVYESLLAPERLISQNCYSAAEKHIQTFNIHIHFCLIEKIEKWQYI